MTEYLRRLFPGKSSTLTKRTLMRFSKHKPVSNIAKGMFSGETSTTFSERFERAKRKVAEVI